MLLFHFKIINITIWNKHTSYMIIPTSNRYTERSLTSWTKVYIINPWVNYQTHEQLVCSQCNWGFQFRASKLLYNIQPLDKSSTWKILTPIAYSMCIGTIYISLLAYNMSSFSIIYNRYLNKNVNDVFIPKLLEKLYYI